MMLAAAVSGPRLEPISSMPRLRLTPSAAFVLALIGFSLTALLSYWLKHDANQLSSLGFSGFTVPDAVSINNSIYLAWTVGWREIPNINTFLGTVLLYYPVMVIGEVYPLIINPALMALSATLFYSTITRLDDLQDPVRVWIVALILVATNFYIVSCLAYPNKEVPLIFLTSAAIFGMVTGKWYLTALSLLLCYWFRDGYALILFMVTIVVLCRRFLFVSGGIIATAFLLLLFVAFPMQYFSSFGDALERNIAIGEVIAGDKFSAHGDLVAFIARLIGNALNLGLRPQMLDVQGGIYLLGVGYWQFGVILLAGLIWSARNLCSSSMARGTLALVIVVTLLGISYGSFVQPRYMMPLMFLLTLGLSESRLGRYVAIPAAVVFPIVFLIVGALPPLADG